MTDKKIRPEKIININTSVHQNEYAVRDACKDLGYNQGLQDEREYRDWLVDNADIEGLYLRREGFDEEDTPEEVVDWVNDLAKAIRQLLKGKK